MSEDRPMAESEIPGRVQLEPLVTINVSPYNRLLIRCQNNERVYDIFFLGGKLQEVIHTEKVKV